MQTHLNNVVKTIAKNYDVDGIHMDYIRLYHDNGGSTNVIEYPADPYTVSLFQQQFPGQTPTSSPANYKQWMADQITELVRDVRTTTKTYRPDAQLTAAVWRDPNIGLNSYQQHWARWVDEGILDAAMPMIYRQGFGPTDPSDLYRTNTTTAVDVRGNSGIMVGLGTYLQSDEDLPPMTYQQAYGNVTAQLNYAKTQGSNGIQLFDYGTLYSSHVAQQGTLKAVQDFFAANKTPPPVAAIANFETGEGTFKWNVMQSGSNQNVASGSADRVTDDARAGAGSQRIVINKTAGAPSFRLRHLSGDPTAGDFASNQQFASIGTVGLWVKTTTPDLRVSISVDDTSTGDRGYLKNVIADGQWHKYEWFLNDVTHWDSWSGGNGEVEPIFSVDSVHFEGTADTNTITIDDVFYDAAAVAPNQWTFDGNANWSHSGNWTGGAPGTAVGARGATANLLRRITADRTVTIDTGATLGTLNIDSAFAYTIAGPGTLSFDVNSGSAAINVLNRGAHTIAAETWLYDPTAVFVDRGSTLTISGAVRNDTGRTITKSGDGTIVLSGLQNHSPGSAVTVNGGRLVLERDLGGAARNHNTRLTVNAAGVAAIRSRQHLGDLTIAGGTVNLVGVGAEPGSSVHTLSLHITGGGKLDVDRQALIVRPGAQTRHAVLQEIENHVRTARNAPTRWQGPGITSSAAAANPLTGLAVILNDDGNGTPILTSYLGQSLDANAVITAYTYNGDVNLDGRINSDDYFRIDRGFLAQPANPGYRDGDFNYDKRVNSDDYFLIDSAFLGQAGPLPLTGTTAGTAAGTVPIPEPSTLLLLALPLALARRTRHGRA